MKTMRKFIEIQQELGLKKFISHPLGTLYFVPFEPGSRDIMVRHFDGELTVDFVIPFANLVQATQQWIEHRPKLARLVKVEQPIEVGYDFIARPFHIYYTSTDAYVEWEDPPDPPEELEHMRTLFRKEIGKSNNPKDILIETVLVKSLLEPSYKTYFAESKGQFIVVEPKLTQEDIEQWNTLSQLSE
jgi:hypothetical protein